MHGFLVKMSQQSGSPIGGEGNSQTISQLHRGRMIFLQCPSARLHYCRLRQLYWYVINKSFITRTSATMMLTSMLNNKWGRISATPVISVMRNDKKMWFFFHVSQNKFGPTTVKRRDYRQVSNIRHTFVGNKIVDHSDVIGATLVGAVPTTSSFSI